ncbi:hypothetical protein JM83_2621 [Gillisia sp. Hel_I_86]|uniref:hypothetical protein n=1 Tax=Gillisia sp. Hel_I_86 TaxID=1249981 RepID=UPI00119AA148|nr:hypothetical protein [Gillisia sp. Hel_I_86]TVZ27571.1 hypothetical protein JM83_2621 [Gillisia sp. Hel_I_86]
MNTNSYKMKYKEWRNPSSLHEETIRCISELEFIDDEIQFLSDLIKEFTLELISGKNFEESKAIINDLSAYKKALKPLLKEIEIHKNDLQTLLDDIDIPDEEDDYQIVHDKLISEARAYNLKVRKLKTKIFGLIKEIMKVSKQKRLLK